LKAYKVSNKTNELSLEEKIQLLESYDLESLLYVLREIEEYPKEYDREVVIAVHNNLFAKGITCI
jgi:hypothetical protein